MFGSLKHSKRSESWCAPVHLKKFQVPLKVSSGFWTVSLNQGTNSAFARINGVEVLKHVRNHIVAHYTALVVISYRSKVVSK